MFNAASVEGVFAARAILGYHCFPPWLIEPVLRRDPLELGDTVGIRFHAVPGLETRVVVVVSGFVVVVVVVFGHMPSAFGGRCSRWTAPSPRRPGMRH